LLFNANCNKQVFSPNPRKKKKKIGADPSLPVSLPSAKKLTVPLGQLGDLLSHVALIIGHLRPSKFFVDYFGRHAEKRSNAANFGLQIANGRVGCRLSDAG